MEPIGSAPAAYAGPAKTECPMATQTRRDLGGLIRGALVWAVIFFSGVWVGRLSGGPGGEVLPGAGRSGTQAIAGAQCPDPGLGVGGKALVSVDDSAATGSHKEAAVSGPQAPVRVREAGLALAQQIFEEGRDPQKAIDFVIGQMSDDELADVISGVTNLTQQDVSSMHDPREFAARLSSIALQTAYAEPGADEWDLDPVHFAKRVAPDNSPDRPSLDFERGTRRIYAVFPSEHSKAEEVMVKWYRTDRPELLMLKKHRIAPRDDQSFVWLERSGGWPQGEYAVEFYTSDERLARIATGQFRVR